MAKILSRISDLFRGRFGAQAPLASLVFVRGTQLGRRVDLKAGCLVIGRSPGCGVELDQESVSRRHAEISVDGQKAFIQDLGSTNGTFVNDALIQRAELADGDCIHIGHNILKFLSGGNLERAYHHELALLIRLDGLTQVHNRRSFMELLGRELSRFQRYERTLSVVLMQVLNLPFIRNAYGFKAADQMLRELAVRMGECLRREDTLARIDDDAFAMILPESDEEQTAAVVARLWKTAESFSLSFKGDLVSAAVVLGQAISDPSASVPEELVLKAGRSLESNKKRRKNLKA